MRSCPWILVTALVAGPALLASAAVDPDPFQLPREAEQFVSQSMARDHSPSQARRMQALLRVIFAKPEQGGMGLIYDNSRTRTVAEVWQERRANCLSMTAFYVAAARVLGIRSTYAEAVNTSHWRRVGSMIRFEHHVVAYAPMYNLVADFAPQLQKRAGRYNVNVLDEKRFRSLYFSNRAVEALDEGQIGQAMALTRQALDCDPKCCVVWNLQGVVEENTGDAGLAEKTFRQAVALDPKDPAPMANLERLLRRDGRNQEADAFQQMSEKVQKRDPFFHADLAEEAIASGDFKEAQRRIKLAQALEPHEPDFFMIESRLRVAQGQWDAAIKAIQAAERDSDPNQRAELEAQVTAVEQLRARGRTNI